MKKRKLSSFLHVKELFIYKGSKEYNDEIMFCFLKSLLNYMDFLNFLIYFIFMYENYDKKDERNVICII